MNQELIEIKPYEFVLFPSSTTPVAIKKDGVGYINIQRDEIRSEGYQNKKAKFMKFSDKKTNGLSSIIVEIMEIIPNFPQKIK